MTTRRQDRFVSPSQAIQSYGWTGLRSRGRVIVWSRALAFTLIELLTVIAIIAVIAALLFPLASVIKRKAMLQTTQTEMAALETAIGNYKSVYGFYPPSNPNGPVTNQLYFELVGTTNTAGVGNPPFYRTLDGSAGITTNDAATIFGVSGFMNCSRPGASESAHQAQDFLPNLKPDQVGNLLTNNNSVVNVLVASVGGPDGVYQPMGQVDVNPWRYNSSNPTNNPGSYDLWIQLVISGKTNLICNWNKNIEINNNSVP